jgi:myo-inositol-1(or 4)-monophosphatase
LKQGTHPDGGGRVVDAREATRAYTFGLRLAERVRDYLVDRRPNSVWTKGNPADLVTDIDIEVETRVRAELSGAFPEHRIVGEEFGSAGGSPGSPTWWIDPIDGTTNYVHGLPWTAFSLALSDRHGPVLGIIADACRGSIASAQRDRGAVFDGVRGSCSGSESLAGEVVFTELADCMVWPGFCAFATELARAKCTLRVMGSSALSLASAARGDAVGCVLDSVAPVDTLAGIIIAREAGMKITETTTDVSAPPAGTLIAAAPGVADELRHAWASAKAS